MPALPWVSARLKFRSEILTSRKFLWPKHARFRLYHSFPRPYVSVFELRQQEWSVPSLGLVGIQCRAALGRDFASAFFLPLSQPKSRSNLPNLVLFPLGNAIRLTRHEMPPLAASHLSVSFFQLWHRKNSAFLENLIYVSELR